MAESVVVDASPIIAWGKMRALDLVSRLPLRFISPVQVKLEVDTGRSKGYPIGFPDWIEVYDLRNRLSRLTLASLDKGEVAVIELALEREIPLVCLDEEKGRRAARAAGLNVIGSLGIAGRLKALGIVEQIGPMVRQAQADGVYYDDELVEQFLRGYDE